MIDSYHRLDPEWQFVVDACRPHPRAHAAAGVRDWARVLGIALQQRVYPRLFPRAGERIPTDHRAALQAHVRQNMQAALANVARTVAAIKALGRAGVEAIVLKGPLQARYLYGDLAARVSGDVDLLVPAPDLLRAAQALAEAGYAHHTALTPASVERHRKREHDIAFAHPEDGILVELHGDIAQPHYGYTIDLAEWWQNRRQAALGDHSVWVLAPENAYLLAALHAAKHRWHRLDLVVDLAGYAQVGLDQAEIRATATRAWLLRPLQIGEEVTAALFGDVAAESWAARAAIGQMVANQELGRMAGIRFDLALRPRFQDKSRYLWKRLISAKLAL